MSHRDQMEKRIEEEARTHDAGCGCRTCRAADGDEEAKRKLLRELM